MDTLKIYIDRLKDEEVEAIDEQVDAEVFDISEKDLKLEGKVAVSGSAYLTKEHLILDLKIETKASMPCSACNKMFTLSAIQDAFSQTVELDEIKGAIYDFTNDIRTQILLKIPAFSECHDGKCPNREELNQFFSKDENLPFSELDL